MMKIKVKVKLERMTRMIAGQLHEKIVAISPCYIPYKAGTLNSFDSLENAFESPNIYRQQIRTYTSTDTSQEPNRHREDSHDRTTGAICFIKVEFAGRPNGIRHDSLSLSQNVENGISGTPFHGMGQHRCGPCQVPISSP